MTSKRPRDGIRFNGLRRRLDELRLAVMFLTRLPVGRIELPTPPADAMWAYPIVGALHGGCMGTTYAASLWTGQSAAVSALLAIAAGLIASGAIHEDGLADCADGFGGGATRERKLTIMRDSRIGTFGTVAVFVALSLKAALIAGLADPLKVVLVLVAVGALTRGLLPLAVWLLPSARADGMAAAVREGLSPGVVLLSLALGLATLILLIPGPSWPAIVAVSCGMGLVVMIAYRQLGGVTGDVLGAAQVIGEITGLLATSAMV